MYMQILRLAVHGHVPTRTANNYCMHHCRSNLKKIDNFLPSSQDLELPSCYNKFYVMFSQVLEKTARVFIKKITELAKLNTVALSM